LKAQIIAVGHSTGMVSNFEYLSTNTCFEFGGNKIKFSYHMDFSVLYDIKQFSLSRKSKFGFNWNVYLKYAFGKQLRLAPTIGYFNRTHNDFEDRGLVIGTLLEYQFDDDNVLFLKNDLAIEKKETFRTTPGGGNSSYIKNQPSYWFAIGIRQFVFKG